MYQIIEVIGMPRRLYHKIWLVMRLTIVILIACLMQVSAAGLAQKITLNQRDVPLSNVLKEIRKQSGYDVFSEGKGLPKNQKVTVVVTNASIEEALDQAFKGLGYTYKIDGKTIAIKPKDEVSFFERIINRFQAIDVRGKVLDEKGQPLVGATVAIKGRNRSVKTDQNGAFFLDNVGESDKLVISFIGYQNREVDAAGNMGSLKMTLDNSELDEVKINAGYYSVSKRELTGSIAKVSSKDIENQPVSNVLSAVQGRVSGVNIIQSSGVPGGGIEIQIRGKNSMRKEGNEVLYIIDGIPQSSETNSLYASSILPFASINPLNALNPNDIESFEILKDADATAIYGSRGANGVVLITTKQGKVGKTELKLNSSYSMSNVAGKMQMMNTQQYLDMRRKAFQNDKVTSIPSAMYDVNGTWDQNRYTDWQKELIGGTAKAKVVQFSLSGGAATSSYLISYSHNEQGTVFPADFKYKSDNLTGNFSYRTPDNKLSVSLNNTISLQNNNVQNSDLTKNSISLSPNAPALYTAEGNINWENSTFNNPIASLFSEYFNKTTFFNNGLNVNYKLFPFLSLKLNGGMNYQVFQERSLKPHTINNPAFGRTSLNSISSKNNNVNFSYIVEPQITADFGNEDHKFNVLIGSTLQRTYGDQGAIQGTGFESNSLINNIAAAKTKVISDQILSEYFYNAAFARVNYQFKNRYILNVTGRRDGSSRFGTENRFGNFGAAGFAWLFDQEDFFKQLSWLTLGKLRGSIGTTGNDKIGDYQYLNTYVTSASIYNTVIGLIPSRLFNPAFSWESTVKKELALDLGVLEGKASLSVAYYTNTSSNQLVGIPLPATTGFSSIQSNLPAKVRNTGWEFDASYQVLGSGELKYETALNLSIPRNKLLEFPGLEGSTYANQYVVGAPMSIAQLYQFEGVDPNTGLYKFKDFNNDGNITRPDDNRSIENLSVNFHGGWSNSFRFKRWSTSFLFQFVKQRSYNYNYIMSTPGILTNKPVEVLDVWSPSNPNGRYMEYTAGYDPEKMALHTLFQSSTAAVSDASFIRLKNVQLNYSLPVQKWGLKNATIYIQGQNLLTFTNYFGMDPEFIVPGWLPPLRTYSFGLQVGF